MLGSQGNKDGSGNHIVYKMLDSSDYLAMSDGKAKAFFAD